jgi:hypothetical protein
MENFYFAVGYTLLLVFVASYYYFHGKKTGIEEACMVFHEKEPVAYKRMKSTLQQEMGIADE